MRGERARHRGRAGAPPAAAGRVAPPVTVPRRPAAGGGGWGRRPNTPAQSTRAVSAISSASVITAPTAIVIPVSPSKKNE